jgi:hypothetical protein
VPPHGAARRRDIASIDRSRDGAVLHLDALQIGLAILRGLQFEAHALPRDQEAAEEFEKPREVRVAGRGRDGLMQGEVLVDCRLAARQRRIDGFERRRDAAAGGGVDPFGRKPGRFDLDAGAQFHDVNHFADRAQPVGVDAERPALHVAHHEGADALARLDKALGAQRGHGLAHHGAADAERRGQFLLGRQPGARREAARAYLGSEPFHDLAGPVPRRTEPAHHGGGGGGGGAGGGEA